MVFCAATNCSNSFKSSISMFDFPKDENLLFYFESRGERGILAHPPTPPIFNVKLIFPNFFCPNQQKQNHSPKSHFTYAIKHNLSCQF